MLSAGLRDWGRGGIEPSGIPRLSEQMDLDRNPKVFYLLKKKRLSSYILNHSKSYQGETNSILNPVFSSSERRQMAHEGRKDHGP